MKDFMNVIESFFQQAGSSANDHRLSHGDTIGWWVERNGGVTYILMNVFNDSSTLRVISPFLILPQENLSAFYRKCLETNMRLPERAICVYEDKVAVVSERTTESIDHEELGRTVSLISKTAEDLGNRFADEFGGTLISESPNGV